MKRAAASPRAHKSFVIKFKQLWRPLLLEREFQAKVCDDGAGALTHFAALHKNCVLCVLYMYYRILLSASKQVYLFELVVNVWADMELYPQNQCAER